MSTKKKKRAEIRKLAFIILGGIVILCALLAKIDPISSILYGEPVKKQASTESVSLFDSSQYPEELNNRIVPLFLQYDDRWGNETYGGDCMSVTGCGPTCLAMVRCGLGQNAEWTPLRVARLAEKSGFYVEGRGSAWSLMSEGAGMLGLSCEKVTFDAAHILKTLYGKKPVICAMGPGDFTTEGHFIVLAGVDESGHILVNDPNSLENSKKTWDIEQIMRQTKNLWAYTLE